MATYRVEWRPSAVRDLKHMDGGTIPRILVAVEALADHPRPSGVRKLAASERTYRIRVGEYRIVYEVRDASQTVTIVRVRHRSDSY